MANGDIFSRLEQAKDNNYPLARYFIKQVWTENRIAFLSEEEEKNIFPNPNNPNLFLCQGQDGTEFSVEPLYVQTNIGDLSELLPKLTNIAASRILYAEGPSQEEISFLINNKDLDVAEALANFRTQILEQSDTDTFTVENERVLQNTKTRCWLLKNKNYPISLKPINKNNEYIWNQEASDNGCPLEIYYIAYDKKKKKKIIFPAEDKFDNNSIRYKKKDTGHYFYLMDHPYYIDNGNIFFLTLLFIQKSELDEKLVKDGEKLKNIDGWTIYNAEGLVDTQKKEFIGLNKKENWPLEENLKKKKTKCWMLEKKSEWGHVGEIVLKLGGETTIHIDTRSEIFPRKNMTEVVKHLQHMIDFDAFSIYNIYDKEYSDSLDKMESSLNKINHSVKLLLFKHQRVLSQSLESISQRSIRKITPDIHRKLLKKINQSAILVNKSKEYFHPSYYPLIKELLSILKEFSNFITSAKKLGRAHIVENNQQIRNVEDSKNTSTINALEKENEQVLEAAEKLDKINRLLDDIKNSQFVREIITSASENTASSLNFSPTFLHHQLNMNLHTNINALKEYYGYERDRRLVDQRLYFYQHISDSVKIEKVSSLYEKWVGVQIISSLTRNFRFKSLEYADNIKELLKNLLINKKTICLSNNKAKCSVEISYEPPLTHAINKDKNNSKKYITPDFKLKFINDITNEQKNLIIDAKYSKYKVDGEEQKPAAEELREGTLFNASIKHIAEKYYATIEENTSVKNIVFVAHPDKDLICNPRRKIQQEKEELSKNERNEFWFDVLLFDGEPPLHFGAIALYPDPEGNSNNNDQLTTLFTMVLRHHLQKVDWCWICNKEAIHVNNNYTCARHWHNEYKCKSESESKECSTKFYVGEHTYITYSGRGWNECPNCRQKRLLELKKNQKISVPKLEYAPIK